jgi:hypothetical protein
MLTREEAEFVAIRLRRGGELGVFWETEEGHEVAVSSLPDGRFAWELFLYPIGSDELVRARTGSWSEDQLVAFLRGLTPSARYLFSSGRSDRTPTGGEISSTHFPASS